MGRFSARSLRVDVAKGREEIELAIHRTLEERPRRDEPVDLIRALEDAIDAVVAIGMGDWIFFHEAVAAEDLHRLIHTAAQRLGAENLGNRAFDRVLLDGGKLRLPVLATGPARVFDHADGAESHGLA